MAPHFGATPHSLSWCDIRARLQRRSGGRGYCQIRFWTTYGTEHAKPQGRMPPVPVGDSGPRAGRGNDPYGIRSSRGRARIPARPNIICPAPLVWGHMQLRSQRDEVDYRHH